VILGQLKHAGFVGSQRGTEGGYSLLRHPTRVTAGDVIRAIEGPIETADFLAGEKESCGPGGSCVFYPMWRQAQEAISSVYDNTTFQNLIEQEKASEAKCALSYSI
jgi:Rrf2 family protein